MSSLLGAERVRLLLHNDLFLDLLEVLSLFELSLLLQLFLFINVLLVLGDHVLHIVLMILQL